MKSWVEGPEPLLNTSSNPKAVPGLRLSRSLSFLAAALVGGGAATFLYLSYKLVNSRVQATMANGDKVQARAIVIASMKLGAFELKNVSALACKGCSLLLGGEA